MWVYACVDHAKNISEMTDVRGMGYGCDICRLDFPSSNPNPAVIDGVTK